MLQRDVAEHHVGGVVAQPKRAAVDHTRRLQSIGATELRHRFATALEKRGIEVAGDHLVEHARETGRHPTDTTADLDDRLGCSSVGQQVERLQVRNRLVIAGVDELRQAQMITGAVVEHPTGAAHNIVGGVLGFRSGTSSNPRNMLSTARHRSPSI